MAEYSPSPRDVLMSFEIAPHGDVGHVRRTVVDVADKHSLTVVLLPNETEEDRAGVNEIARAGGTFSGDISRLIGDIILTGQDRVPVAVKRTIPDDSTWYPAVVRFHTAVTDRIF